MAHDKVLGTLNAKLWVHISMNLYNFWANAKKVVKMRENTKTPKVKKWRIFLIKVTYFSVCFGVFKFLAFSSHFFRSVPSHFMQFFALILDGVTRSRA